MIKRIITGLIIIGCVLPPLLIGGDLLKVLVGVIIIVGGFELISLLSNRKSIPTLFLAITFSFVIVASFLPLIKGVSLMSLLFLLVLSFQIFNQKFTSEDAFFLIAILSILFAFASSFNLIYSSNHMFIWFILLATYGCDTGAYFIGSLFGKTKLIPSISPNKTLEGAIGGWVIGASLSFFFALIFIKDINLLILILGCIWLPIISQVGDLSFSAIKRYFNIKDFSNVFPGHGGFMDRIDSLVFNLIAFSALLVFSVL